MHRRFECYRGCLSTSLSSSTESFFLNIHYSLGLDGAFNPNYSLPMGRYTRGKTTIHLFFLNDHMISLTTTITISPQKLKQQVVYWLHLALVMRWIPRPITLKADTSCMFKKECENAVLGVGHLSLCFMERYKTIRRLPQKCLAVDF